MIRALLAWLRPWHELPVVWRYCLTTIFVLLALVTRLSLGADLEGASLFMFMVPILVASVLFDRNSGFYATLLSALLVNYFFMPPFHTFLITRLSVGITLIVFIAVGATTALLAEALRRSNDELEHRVAERTAELEEANRRLAAEVVERVKAEEQLRHAQKMEALGRMSAGIAHDFNNLLTAALGNLDRLVERLDDEKLRGLAEQSLAATERAEVLTRKLLAFGRKQPLRIETLDLAAVLREMADLIERTLSHNTRFELCLLEDLWPVRADRDQLELAVLNLAANARDALPESGGRLTITAANVASAGGVNAEGRTGEFVALSVSDTGAGIPAEIRDRIFEPFFTTKASGKGTGLGLAMVYGFANQLGGTATVSSEEGQGTQVTLYLPRGGGGDSLPAIYVRSPSSGSASSAPA